MSIDVKVTKEFAADADAARLHDEARGTKTNWPASFVELEDGSWVYRVDRDDVDAAAVEQAVAAHVPPPPPPDPVDEFRKAVEAASSLAALKAALLGNTGPGAQPRGR